MMGRFREYLSIIRLREQLTSEERIEKAIADVGDDWKERIDRVLGSPVSSQLKRVAGAGTLSDGLIKMHNGVKVAALSYYGGGITRLLMENRGSHEPEEEYIFEDIIDRLCERPSMLELGAYWGFYSLSLLNKRPEARCFLVEPNPENLMAGRVNFQINRRKGFFLNSYAGEKIDDIPDAIPAISVDDFLVSRGIAELDILHSDIQGGEAKMLLSASKSLEKRRINYLFISTHWDQIHAECTKQIMDHGYHIACDITPSNSYSYDGLIFASRHPMKTYHFEDQ